MTEPNSLYSTPKACKNTLKAIFSLKNADITGIAKKLQKKEGYIPNPLHDLQILGLIIKGDNGKFKVNEEKFQIAKKIVYDRETSGDIRKLFESIPGNKDAIEELQKSREITPINIGKIFGFHSNSRAVQESSWKQLGSRYLAWLKIIGVLNEEGDLSNTKDDSKM